LTKARREPWAAAQALKAALRGAEALKTEVTIEEDVGFLLLADLIHGFGGG
jgi:hypothetical protein